jgi:chromosome segregation ATPase
MVNKKILNIAFIFILVTTFLSISASVYLYIIYSEQEKAFNRDKAVIMKNFNEIQKSLHDKTEIIDSLNDGIFDLKKLINDKTQTIDRLREKIDILERTLEAQDENFGKTKARLESVEGGLSKVLMDIEDTVKNLDNFTEFEHGWRQDYNKALMDLLARVQQVNSEVKAICDLYDIKFEYVEAAN